MPQHVHHCESEVKSVFPSHNKCNKINPPSSITGRIINNYATTKGCTSHSLDKDKKCQVCSNLSSEIMKYQKEGYSDITNLTQSLHHKETTPKITPINTVKHHWTKNAVVCHNWQKERRKNYLHQQRRSFQWKKKTNSSPPTQRHINCHHTRSQPNPLIWDVENLKLCLFPFKKLRIP